MLDLVITGGTCVLPTGSQPADIGVKDGRIVLVGGPGSLPDATRTVSAKDRLVIPGGIDPHIHCSMPVKAPGRPDVLTDPPSQVSKAALHGGTTTLIDFVQCLHERTIQESIEQQLDDETLSPEGIAAAHHISVRYINKLFEREGTSLARWIRMRRLERCRMDLEDPGKSEHSISDIAYAHGFGNISSFNRAFRSRFGLSPRTLRNSDS